MKRLTAILLILACVLSAPIAAYAANEAPAPVSEGNEAPVPAPDGNEAPRLSDGKYSNIGELFQYWEANGYPDYVGSVYSTSGGPALTVLLVNDDGTGAEQIRALLADDSGVSFGTAEFSYNTLKAVNDEIVANYLGSDEKVYSVAVGWTSADGVVTGFGESGKESRVVVSVDESVLAEYADKFYELYGDMVVVEAGEAPVLLDDNLPDSNVWLLPLIIFMVMIVGASLLMFNRARLIPVMQTTKGTVAAQPAPVSRKETIAAIRNSEISPSDKVFNSILREIDKNDG